MFLSRQGEGKLTGTETFFIRTNGCNLRCHFCDTPYASWNPKGTAFTTTQLVQQAIESRVQHVVLTGGEPLLPTAIGELTEQLRENGFHITIETAGTIDRDVHCDLMSISPKLASSTPAADAHPRWARLHEERRMPIATMRRLMDQAKEFQIKFVITSPSDFDEVHQIAEQLHLEPASVWIMPEGVCVQDMDRAKAWLEPICIQHGYQYCDRMQIRWYGNRRGT